MSCSIDDCDGTNDVATTELRKARKEHKCSACRGTIRKGDTYSYSFFVYEREASVVKRCARCEVLYRELDARQPDGAFCDAKLNCGHTYEENFGEAPPPELASLAFVTADEAQSLLLAQVTKGAA